MLKARGIARVLSSTPLFRRRMELQRGIQEPPKLSLVPAGVHRESEKMTFRLFLSI